jgi:hypothetical protein
MARQRTTHLVSDHDLEQLGLAIPLQPDIPRLRRRLFAGSWDEKLFEWLVQRLPGKVLVVRSVLRCQLNPNLTSKTHAIASDNDNPPVRRHDWEKIKDEDKVS